jgi:hypothetical protein
MARRKRIDGWHTYALIVVVSALGGGALALLSLLIDEMGS